MRLMMGDGVETERGGQNLTRELLKVVTSPDFRTGYIQTQTAQARTELDEIPKGFKKAAGLKATVVKERLAAEKMGKPLEEAVKDARNFRIMMDEVSREQVDQTSPDGTTLQKSRGLVLFEQSLEEVESDPQTLKRTEEAETKLKAEETRAGEELTKVIEEVRSRFADKLLIAALASWGKAPNSAGEKGEKGGGFNSGIIHYFEYRANPEKNGRYKNHPPMSVDGFIGYTDRLMRQIENPTGDDILGARYLKDSDGQERLFLVNSRHELIIGFKRKDEDKLKIVTVVPGQDENSLEKRVKDEMAPGNDKGRLNALGESIEEVSLVPAIA